MADDVPIRLADFRLEEPEPTPRPPRRKRVRTPGHGSATPLWLAAAVLVGVGYAILHLTLRLWWPFFATVGGSMYPTILPGEIAVVAQTPAASLHVGEIVLARVPAVDRRTYGYAGLLLHRIVALGGAPGRRWIRTRGDHNPAPEPFAIPAHNVVGRLVALVPYAGYALLFLRSRFALLAAGALLALYGLYRLVDWALAASESGPGSGPAVGAADAASDSAGQSREPQADAALLDALTVQEAILRDLARDVHDLRTIAVAMWLERQSGSPAPWDEAVRTAQAGDSPAPLPPPH